LVEPGLQLKEGRFMLSGDESGTAPEDRPFRPDVEGLRAVAVLLVVLFHSSISALSGGYVGVDVFFVISGFVITGVLLRERATSGRTSILAFYGRRCRRIIPAATLVILATVALSYAFLGSSVGAQTAIDGRWASVFLANFHFSAIGTNYLASQRPPSPLQNYWSLSVEEQFYVVYPTLFLLLAGIGSRLSLRVRLTVGLVIVICASLAFSIVDTANDPTGAYFSPFTRAWELALGALVAVGTPWLLKVPEKVAAIAAWLGFAAVLVAATTFTSHTAYPGSLISIPVVGAALIIAGGVRASRLGVEALLGLPPVRWLGKLSYSLYLWHWPILIVAAEHAGRTSLSVPDNLGWDLVALAAAAVTYTLAENPIRHARVLRRMRWSSVGLGAALVATTLGGVTLASSVANASGVAVGSETLPTSNTGGAGPGAPLQTVLHLVAAADNIRTVPANLVPPIAVAAAQPSSNAGWPPDPCSPSVNQTSVPACVFGDSHGSRLMVLYGDSHAAMWFDAINEVATRAHWRLIILSKGSCSAAPIPTHPPGALGEWTACDAWHRFAIAKINHLDPELLVVSQDVTGNPQGVTYTPAQWRHGLRELFKLVTAPKTAKVILGNIPPAGGPNCLALHVDNVRTCSSGPQNAFTPYNTAEMQAAAAGGARYIDVTPWFCARICPSIIGNFDVYFNASHVAVGYSRFLEGVLAQTFNLSSFGQSQVEH